MVHMWKFQVKIHNTNMLHSLQMLLKFQRWYLTVGGKISNIPNAMNDTESLNVMKHCLIVVMKWCEYALDRAG